ncbi:MAG TPA: hypothetical protein PKD90_14480, partial [Phnomibacter sp.]|nr:hypothetical protein [Phnomibacter sp.]
QWRAFWQWQRLVELAVPLIIGILSWLIFKFQKNARNAIQNHDAVFFEKSLYWLGYWFIALALACMLALAFLSLVLYVLIVH